MEIDSSVKFAWAYLIKHGKRTNGKWCFYAGWEEIDTRYLSWGVLQEEKKEFEEMILSVGIDWDKTEPPTVKEESQFNGTFNSASEKLATLGTLYLKNGDKYMLASDQNDAAHLAETARKIWEEQKSDGAVKSDVSILAEKL